MWNGLRLGVLVVACVACTGNTINVGGTEGEVSPERVLQKFGDRIAGEWVGQLPVGPVVLTIKPGVDATTGRFELNCEDPTPEGCPQPVLFAIFDVLLMQSPAGGEVSVDSSWLPEGMYRLLETYDSVPSTSGAYARCLLSPFGPEPIAFELDLELGPDDGWLAFTDQSGGAPEHNMFWRP